MRVRPPTIILGILGIALVAWGPAPAKAALIDITVTGVVGEVGSAGGFSSVFSVGQSMSASFTYDSNTPGPVPLTSSKPYPNAVTGGTYAIGTYVGSALSGDINIANDDPTFNDSFRLEAHGLSSPSIPPDHLPAYLAITLEDASKTVFSSLDLPLALGLASFGERTWYLQFTPIPLLGVDSNNFVSGRLSTLEITVREVPGPPTVLLVLLAGGGALARAWWRRPRRVEGTTR